MLLTYCHCFCDDDDDGGDDCCHLLQREQIHQHRVSYRHPVHVAMVHSIPVARHTSQAKGHTSPFTHSKNQLLANKLSRSIFAKMNFSLPPDRSWVARAAVMIASSSVARYMLVMLYSATALSTSSSYTGQPLHRGLKLLTSACVHASPWRT